MKFRINFNSLIFLLINFILITPIFLFLDKDCNLYITIIVAIQLILTIYLFKKKRLSLLSLQFLFILLSTIFHFGEAYLLAIGREHLFTYTNIELARSMETYNKANVFSILVQAFVVFGMINLNIRNNYEKELTYIDENKKLKRVYTIGIVLFVIGVIPNFMYYYSQIKIVLNGGIYHGIRSAIDYGPLYLLKVFYEPGVYMLIIGSKNNKKRARIIMIFAIIFELFCMITGNRASQLLKIITYLFIYYRIISNITLKKSIIYLIIGYFLSVVLYFISVYRNFNILDMSLLIDRFVSVLEKEPFYSLLAQLGSNLNVVVLTLVSIPKFNSFNFGLTYIVSWLSIYPNTGGILGNIPNMYSFLNYLDTDLPLGGSYIGELYFNFGWLGLFFAIFIGLFIGYVGDKIEISIYKKNWIKFSLCIILFSKLLWWVRDYFSSWIYPFIWTFVAINLINTFIIKVEGGNR